MPRHSPSSTALPSGAGGVGYIPGIRTDWSTPEPESVQQALDNIGSSRVHAIDGARHTGTLDHSEINDDEATKHRIINDLGTLATQLWSASKIDTELIAKTKGPASSTDNAIARYHLATGKILQNSLALLNDAGDITTPGAIVATGAINTIGWGNSGVFLGSANEYIANDGSGTLTILAATAVVVGNAGNTILGDGTLRELRPHTTEKISLGSLSKAFFDVCAAQLRLLERSADPTEPSEGNGVIWMSDGTGKGDDGDILIASRAGGVTKYATLFDHSAGGAW